MSLRWILSLARPWRWALALSSLLMLAETALALAIPWLAGRYAGDLLGGSAPAGGLLLALVGVLAAQALLAFASSWVTGNIGEQVLASLRTRLYDHLQALPLGWYHQRRHGDVVALLTYDVERLSGYLTGTLPGLLPLAVSVLGALVLMAGIDARLTLLVLLALPVFFVVMKLMGRRLRPLSGQLQQAYADTMAVAEENLQMLPAIKTFTREGLESARYQTQVDRLVHLSRQERRIYAAMGPTVQFLAGAGMVLVLWLLGSGQGRSPAEMVSFLLYAAMLTRPVGALANVYGQTRQVRGALERLGEVLQEAPEQGTAAATALPRVAGEIELSGLHFAYPGREPVLRGLSLHIRAGETVALTGSNGAGKSTLVQLLMRLVLPAGGTVRIDGHDIAGVSLESLRRQIGVVPQQVLLFNGTVFDNIAWGLPGASAEAVEAAARKAQAHGFIGRLPQGYQTRIGDHGVRLSGGQRQRLALARALLKDPPILVLDEATAMFDPEAERSFVAECHDALARRTVILITHRPASLALADRVLLLEDGVLRDVTPPRPGPA